jgi:hypothetical protein
MFSSILVTFERLHIVSEISLHIVAEISLHTVAKISLHIVAEISFGSKLYVLKIKVL